MTKEKLKRYIQADECISNQNYPERSSAAKKKTFASEHSMSLARSGMPSVELNKKLEIASCMGNISLKDSEIMVHAHIVLADWEGKAFGGHLMPGTKIFAAEFQIQEYVGTELHRGKDEKTGLPLWQE